MRTRTLSTLALLAMCAVTACDDEQASPMALDRGEFKLAAYTSTMTSTSAQEPVERSVTIEFGVFDQAPANYDEIPDVVLFANRVLQDQEKFRADSSNTPDFKTITSRLSNNIDQVVYVSGIGEFVQSTQYSDESSVFTYGNTGPGPDFAGSRITAIMLHARINVTENGGLWTTEITYGLTVLGY